MTLLQVRPNSFVGLTDEQHPVFPRIGHPKDFVDGVGHLPETFFAVLEQFFERPIGLQLAFQFFDTSSHCPREGKEVAMGHIFIRHGTTRWR